MNTHSTARLVAAPAWFSVRRSGVEGDSAGTTLIALAMMAAPTSLWAIAILGGQGVTLSYLVAAVTIVVGIRRVRELPRAAVLPSILLTAVLAWGLAALFVTLQSEDVFLRGLRHAVLFLFCLTVFAAASTIRFSMSSFSRHLRLVGVVYCAIVVYAIYQVAARRLQWPFAFLEVTNPTYNATLEDSLQSGSLYGAESVYFARASSLFVEPSYLGFYLAYGTAVSLACYASEQRSVRRIGVFGLVLSLVGFVANQSLTGVLCLGVVIGIGIVRLAIAGQRRRALGIVMLAMASAACLLFVPGASDELISRLSGLSVSESSERFSALPIVVAAFADHPLGLGFAMHVLLGEIQNGIFLLAVQFGILGLLVPVCWMGSVVLGVTRAGRMGRSAHSVAAENVMAAASFLAIHVCVWASCGSLYEPFPWTMSGLAFSMLSAKRRVSVPDAA